MIPSSSEVSSASGPAAPLKAAGFALRIVESDAALVTAHVSGELDMLTAPGFAHQLNAVCDAGARQLVIDLSGLAFIDSSGLSALVSTLKRYRAAGGDVVLRSPTRATAKVLEICGLKQIFTIENADTDGTDPADR